MKTVKNERETISDDKNSASILRIDGEFIDLTLRFSYLDFKGMKYFIDVPYTHNELVDFINFLKEIETRL